jgi:hypothetical protein
MLALHILGRLCSLIMQLVQSEQRVEYVIETLIWR